MFSGGKGQGQGPFVQLQMLSAAGGSTATLEGRQARQAPLPSSAAAAMAAASAKTRPSGTISYQAATIAQDDGGHCGCKYRRLRYKRNPCNRETRTRRQGSG